MKFFARSGFLGLAALALSLATPSHALDLGGQDTFGALDAQAYRVTTDFGEVHAVAEIFNDHEIRARLISDRDGFLGEVILSRTEQTLRASYPKLSSRSVKTGGIQDLK